MNERERWGTRWILGLYRATGRALPITYRDAYLDESLSDLREILARARARGGGRAEAWAGVRALMDLTQRIPREWWKSKGIRSRPHARGEEMMGALNELRTAARALRRRPAFTTVSVLTLALGIGANVAIFAVVNAVLIRPLGFPDSERIVAIDHHAPGLDLPDLTNSEGTLRLYREEAPVLSCVAGYEEPAANLVSGEGEPVRVKIAQVTPSLFQVLETRPALGRPFGDADAAEGAAPVTILTHAEWVSRFGSDPDVVGEFVRLDGVSTEIVGVMPKGFTFIDPRVAVLRPLHLDPRGGFETFGIRGIARLAPGVTFEQAQRRLTELQARIPAFFGEKDITADFLKGAGWSVTIESLRDQIVGDVSSALWVILGTVGFVLLIACANVVNLVLVRADSRRNEIAIRSAMGAGKGRLASVFLSETLLLGALGGLGGMLLAWGGVRLLVSFGPATLPRLHEISLDPVALALAAALSVGVGFVSGAIPLARVSGWGSVRTLREGGRGSTDGRERHRARNVLVTAQLAMALVLLIGSSLMVRTFERLRSVDPGFDAKSVLAVGLSFGNPGPSVGSGREQLLQGHKSLMDAARFYQQVADQVAALPGVEHVGLTNALPMGSGIWNGGSFEIEGHPRADDALPPIGMYKAVGPGYFESMGMTLVRGRTERPSDSEDGVPVVWINETFAKTLPGDALGTRIRWGHGADSTYAEIVGIVKDVREFGLNQPVRAVAYLPLVVGRWGFPQLDIGYLTVKTSGDATALAKSIREIAHRLNASVPITSTQTMSEVVARSIQRTSFTLVLLGIATLVALSLGTIGLFGVISYVVGQRRREIGVRVALGARPDDIRTMVLRQGAVVGLIGVAVGLGGALALTRLMKALLFDVSATDPVSFLSASVLLLATAALATWVPARRASRVDPVEALRAE